MDEGDDNVKRLPVRFKAPPGADEPQLKIVHHTERDRCDHKHYFVDTNIRPVTYLIRDGETEVECGHCNTKLDPMWVLRRLAMEENKWRETGKRYQEEMERLAGRERTKCEHCEKMTRISRR